MSTKITIHVNDLTAYWTANGQTGSIEGDAARALSDLYEHGVLSDDQRIAIQDYADAQGWDRSQVVLADVGPLWP